MHGRGRNTNQNKGKGFPMDKNTHVSLHRRRIGRVDQIIKSGRFEDLYREFKAVAPSKQSEYFIMEGRRKYDPQEMDQLARQLGIGS